MGRTKFKQLMQKLNEVRHDEHYRALWLYGTQGYGKSHLLAALVCYLAAQDERVVYIPDCRSLIDNPIAYVKTAMLFAWADDVTTQKEIIATLNTTHEIDAFFYSQKNVIFVVDQMNAFKTGGNNDPNENRKLHRWIRSFTSRHKTVFSSSANHTDYLEQFNKQSSNRVLRVRGGLDDVSYSKFISISHNEASNSIRPKCTSGGSDIKASRWEITAGMMLKILRAASHCSWTSAWCKGILI